MTKIPTIFRAHILLASILWAIGSPAQTTPPPAAPAAPAAAEVPKAKPTTGTEQSLPVVSHLEKEMMGGIDWENHVVYGVGDGVPPPNAVSPAQARVRAKRAALDEAMARLLELTKDVQVDAQSTTRDMINESRVVSDTVSGVIRNAEEEEIRQHDDGSYQIKLKMPFYGQKGLSATLMPLELAKVAKVSVVMRATRADTPAAPEAGKAGAPAAAEKFTALIVDATGRSPTQALYPRILSRSGEVLFDLSRVDPNVAVQQGICAYHKGLATAKGKERAGGNPLVVKAIEVAGASRVDLILEEADAKKVTEADQAGDFIHQGKVIIVTD